MLSLLLCHSRLRRPSIQVVHIVLLEAVHARVRLHLPVIAASSRNLDAKCKARLRFHAMYHLALHGFHTEWYCCVCSTRVRSSIQFPFECPGPWKLMPRRRPCLGMICRGKCFDDSDYSAAAERGRASFRKFPKASVVLQTRPPSSIQEDSISATLSSIWAALYERKKTLALQPLHAHPLRRGH